MRSSQSSRTSSEVMGMVLYPGNVRRQFSLPVANERADVVAGDGLFDVAFLLVVEDQDRQLRLATVVAGARVHDAQFAVPDLLVGQMLVAVGVDVLLRVVGVDTVHAGGLQQDVTAQLAGAEGGGGVGGDERAAGATGQDDDPALL